MGVVMAMVTILLAATWLRAAHLATFPPGLYHDVAFNGLDDVNILHGHLAIFFPANNGREPLYFYVQAATVAMFGQSVFGLRFASSIFGLLTVAAAFPCARRLFGVRVGLLTAAALAGSLWHAYISRIGLRVVGLPLFATLLFYLLFRALECQSWRTAVLAGLAGAAAIYDHTAGRLLPVVVALLTVPPTLCIRGNAQRSFRLLVIVAVTWFVLLVPFGLYFLTHPEQFIGRIDQVSWLSAEYNDANGHRLVGPADRWRHIAGSALDVAGMYVIRGDANPRQNVPYRPVFDPLLGLCFFVGLARAVISSRPGARPARVPGNPYRWILAWWFIMAFSSAFSQQSPHFHRTAGSISPTYIFVALGIDWLWQTAALRDIRLQPALACIATVLFAWQGWRTSDAFFQQLAHRADVAARWEVSLRNYADALATATTRTPRPSLYLQVGSDSRDMRLTSDFLAPAVLQARWIPPDQTVVPLPARPTGDVLYGGDTRLPLVDTVTAVLPGAALVNDSPGSPGKLSYRLFRVPRGSIAADLRAERPVDATFGGQVRLLGVWLRRDAPSSSALTVVGHWALLPGAHGAYDLFVQVLTPAGTLAAQDDHGIEATALTPTETGLTLHRLALPLATPPGDDIVIVGVATPDGKRRLAPAGQHLHVTADAVVVATVARP